MTSYTIINSTDLIIFINLKNKKKNIYIYIYVQLTYIMTKVFTVLPKESQGLRILIWLSLPAGLQCLTLLLYGHCEAWHTQVRFLSMFGYILHFDAHFVEQNTFFLLGLPQ